MDTRYPASEPGDFPQITVEWFREAGCPHPDEAFSTWSQWLTENRTAHAKYQKALELACNVSRGAVGHYLSPVRGHKLSERTRTRLDRVSERLGVPPPERRPRPQELVRQSGARRIAIMGPLSSTPSHSFYLNVMASLVRAADTQNFDAVVHDLGSLGLYTTVSRLVSGYRPDAVVLIRWTPDGRSLEVLRRTSVPVVLIHADRLQYPAPVIANIVPAQERLVPYVYKWAKGVLEKARPREGRGYDERIVMAAMPDEAPVWEFPPIPGVTPAIRNHRKELIREALQGLPSEWVEVPDYSFRHALTVWRRFPTAAGYLCLSDELAVGVKHLLVATGDVTSGRLVGFDDGPLASADDLTSFGQRIDEIGPAAMELLRAWFNAASRGGVRFSPAQEIPTGFHLAERD